MHRIARATALLAGWFVTVPTFAGDPLVIDLWPGKVPGDFGIKAQETGRIHQSPLVGPTKLITNVSKPTLTIYRPDQARNTGTARVRTGRSSSAGPSMAAPRSSRPPRAAARASAHA